MGNPFRESRRNTCEWFRHPADSEYVYPLLFLLRILYCFRLKGKLQINSREFHAYDSIINMQNLVYRITP